MEAVGSFVVDLVVVGSGTTVDCVWRVVESPCPGSALVPTGFAVLAVDFDVGVLVGAIIEGLGIAEVVC